MTARSGAVLVVDDDKINRMMLSKLLENEGYRPTTVVDGEEALRAVAKESFDALLLDIVMPGIDGIEVLRSLKSDSRWWHIPVIMISAVEETDSIARCIELGAEDYLLKPFDPVLLRARVSACLARKRFHDLEEEYHTIVKEQRAELSELNRQLSQRVWAQEDRSDRPAPHRANVVVVTFALSGTDALAETAGAVDAVEIMNAFHATLAEPLSGSEATVAGTTVDRVTVVFSDPLRSTDAAVRARRLAAAAADQFSAPLAEWNRRHGVELTLGIGIATGEATLGEIGPEARRDYVALGAVVDRADRLAQESFPGGGVRLDDGTRAALEDAATVDTDT